MTTYSTGKAARLLGVSLKTLQRWDAEGKLQAKRTPSARRFYPAEDRQQFRGSLLTPKERFVVVYMRVSSLAQKPDRQNQKRALEQFCVAQGMSVAEWIEELGGGLNFKRTKFVNLFDRISAGEIKTLVIAHKDRLARFGFDFLQHLCRVHNCELLVMNTESLSLERGMVEDLMAITHCFSARLYGLRNYKNTLKVALRKDEKGA